MTEREKIAAIVAIPNGAYWIKVDGIAMRPRTYIKHVWHRITDYLVLSLWVYSMSLRKKALGMKRR